MKKITRPCTKVNTHPWVGEYAHIPNFQMVSIYFNLFKCYCIFTYSGLPPPPPCMLGGWVVLGGATHMHMEMHMYLHSHTCCAQTDAYMLNMAASMVGAICNFLTLLYYLFVYVHVYMSRDSPVIAPDPPKPCGPPDSGRDPK